MRLEPVSQLREVAVSLFEDWNIADVKLAIVDPWDFPLIHLGPSLGPPGVEVAPGVYKLNAGAGRP